MTNSLPEQHNNLYNVGRVELLTRFLQIQETKAQRGLMGQSKIIQLRNDSFVRMSCYTYPELFSLTLFSTLATLKLWGPLKIHQRLS